MPYNSVTSCRRRRQRGRGSALALPLALALASAMASGQEARLPVVRAKAGFTLEQARELAQSVSVASVLKGGDVALYWTGHVSESMPTTVIPATRSASSLPYAQDSRIGQVRADSALGNLSLDEFLVDSRSYAQGFVVIHRGRIVYEQYPGMNPEDAHLWASNAKPLASLVIDLLIDDGLLDPEQTYGHYMPDFRGTAWEDIRILDLLDMTPGLDTEEDDSTRADPDSIATRTFLAEFGEPNLQTGEQETVREVLKSARKVREPGTSFDYSSPVTQALVLLTEEVTQKRWADVFNDRVWSHMAVEGGLQVHLAPDGLAAVHGVVSSRLRDMARFGMLYTPSWRAVSDQPIVTDDIVQRIRQGVRGEEFFMSGYDGPVFTQRLNAPILGSSRQWDAVFADGDFFKSGMFGQGLYVSPDRDLVVGFFSTTPDTGSIQRYLRPLVTSGLFDADVEQPHSNRFKK
ncbi:serine hydrolase domain-containing protein [Parahaliea mediterranea]|uniref:Beta-lactamase family protein n=1 Tax=Parahaliea mediterranea TaxID=651086 RepID=A0A939IKB6_9GAMM|nr:serine hydrolase domain-containing protein [Parahaliea mediterranea]MBN7797161.1 beta-lactamase family protein [Parahaliea mediterranea]